jgi:hypothetical protein
MSCAFGAADYRTALDIKAWEIGETEATRRIDRYYLRPAAELVNENWVAILRVAAALNFRGYLTYAEVKPIWRG